MRISVQLAFCVIALLLSACAEGPELGLDSTAGDDLGVDNGLVVAPDGGEVEGDLGAPAPADGPRTLEPDAGVSLPVDSGQRQQDVGSPADSALPVDSGPMPDQGQGTTDSNLVRGPCTKDSPNWPTKRDHLQWPFHRRSAWNMPIGCKASYVNARLETPTVVDVDHDVFVPVKKGDPLTRVLVAGGLPNNNHKFIYGSGVDRCRGNLMINYREGGAPFEIPFPRGFELGSRGRNYSTAITTADQREIYQLNAFARCKAGGPMYGLGRPHLCKESLFADGMGCSGGHGGTGLSSIGGTLRASDFVNDQPIRHALKLNLRPYQFYLDRSKGKCEARWPARRCDNSISKYPTSGPMANLPSSKEPANKQGALLALPRDASYKSLGIRTAAGRKLFDALQDYGTYTVDGSGTSPDHIRVGFSATSAALGAFAKHYGFGFEVDLRYKQPTGARADWAKDMQAIIRNLHVVNDNREDNIGGTGPARFRPLAPAL